MTAPTIEDVQLTDVERAVLQKWSEGHPDIHIAHNLVIGREVIGRMRLREAKESIFAKLGVAGPIFAVDAALQEKLIAGPTRLPATPLIPKELMEVASRILRGMPQKAIAAELGVSTRQIHNRILRLRAVTGARNMPHALAVLRVTGRFH